VKDTLPVIIIIFEYDFDGLIAENDTRDSCECGCHFDLLFDYQQ